VRKLTDSLAAAEAAHVNALSLVAQTHALELRKMGDQLTAALHADARAALEKTEEDARARVLASETACFTLQQKVEELKAELKRETSRLVGEAAWAATKHSDESTRLASEREKAENMCSNLQDMLKKQAEAHASKLQQVALESQAILVLAQTRAEELYKLQQSARNLQERLDKTECEHRETLQRREKEEQEATLRREREGREALQRRELELADAAHRREGELTERLLACEGKRQSELLRCNENWADQLRKQDRDLREAASRREREAEEHAHVCEKELRDKIQGLERELGELRLERESTQTRMQTADKRMLGLETDMARLRESAEARVTAIQEEHAGAVTTWQQRLSVRTSEVQELNARFLNLQVGAEVWPMAWILCICGYFVVSNICLGSLSKTYVLLFGNSKSHRSRRFFLADTSRTISEPVDSKRSPVKAVRSASEGPRCVASRVDS
jgi:hypothetical protein